MNFWTQFPQAACYPSCGCEPLADSLIRQPWAFWSSFAYIFVAWFIYKRATVKSLELKLWSGVLCYLAVSSGFAHASYLRLAMAMDFSSIVVILSFFSVINFLKLLRRSQTEIIIWFSTYSVVLVGCFYFIHGVPRIVLCLMIFFLAVGDLFRDLRSEMWQGRAKPFWLSMGILALSFCAFVVDTFGLICEPLSWLHGHTLWHIGAALSIYFYGVWRFQLPSISSKKES